MIQTATAEAKSNIALIKWTMRQHLAHYLDRAAGDWKGKPRHRDEYRRCYDDLRNQIAHA